MPFLLPREDPKIYTKKMAKRFSFNGDILQKIEQGNGNVRIQIRCVKVDGVGYNNIWPSEGAIILNEKTIMEPHKLPQKMDMPMDITDTLVGGENLISVLKYNDFQYYIAAVFLIEAQNSS